MIARSLDGENYVVLRLLKSRGQHHVVPRLSAPA